MAVFAEFRKFIMKGNVVDLAIGVVIGAAFGKIVSSLVADIVMPPIGIIVGGVDFRDIKFALQEAKLAADGAVLSPAVTLNIGIFLQTVIDFLIIGSAVFAVVKVLGALQKVALREKQAVPVETPPVELSNTEKLLMEIRDALKEQALRK